MSLLPWLLSILAAYLIGSIPFGVLIGRAKGLDIRAHGSKNIGATNVGRVLGRKLGLVCFALDTLKGAVPVAGAGFVCGVINTEPAVLSQAQMWLWLLVAAAAVTGHMASIFLAFAGGKGVATGFGAALAMWPLLTFPALGALAVWYATLRLGRYVSLASMAAAVSLPLWYLLRCIPPSGENIGSSIVHASPPLIVTAALALLILWRHRTNIARLRRGEEPRIGECG
ncbi:MAG: glycerol-3-phosphate 1-O-acyltransferase PlsY [Planctomycetota bacterium]|nr:glycerol-3-phosphate 1-O-acyltransferase PlsY [Planctomycetota bacterium]